MTQSEPLQHALQLLRAGDRAGARKLLRSLVQSEPQNEAAWLWLASCVDDLAEKTACLRRALSLNPDNETARQALQRLEAPQPGLEDLLSQPRAASPAGAAFGFLPMPRVAGRLYLASLAGVLVLIIMVAAALLYFVVSYTSGCGGAAASQTYTVEYVVDGAGSDLLLTFSDGGGNYSQEQVTSLPWRKTFTMYADAQPSISAQSGSDPTNITCEILLEGQPWKSASSNAAYGSVACSGMIGLP